MSITTSLTPGLTVNLTRATVAYAELIQHCRYRYGAKPNSLHTPLAAITQLDCSGFARLLLAYASWYEIIIPDGSISQRQWCEDVGLHHLESYHDISETLLDVRRLFLAFLPPIRSRAGHVWLVRAGNTMECHAGVGVGSRPWDTPVLRRNCDAVYELPASP